MIDAASVDLLKVGAFALAIFINRQAVVLLAAHLTWELGFMLPLSDFWMCLYGATLYALAATAFVRLKSELRYVMLTISGLYYLGAIDAYLFPTIETMYYVSIPYLISAMDLYALLIICKGGRQRVGANSPSVCRIFGLQLL